MVAHHRFPLLKGGRGVEVRCPRGVHTTEQNQPPMLEYALEKVAVKTSTEVFAEIPAWNGEWREYPGGDDAHLPLQQADDALREAHLPLQQAALATRRRIRELDRYAAEDMPQTFICGDKQLYVVARGLRGCRMLWGVALVGAPLSWRRPLGERILLRGAGAANGRLR